MELVPEKFSEFMEQALYGQQGFYTQGKGAGRDRDYITSPEVGDLFGRIIAAYIDDWYESLETNEPAIVIDAGCGPGSLAASIARAQMRNAKMIDYFLVDRSPVHLENCDKKLGSIQTEFTWSLHESIPECEFPTLIVANELLDNLVFNIGRTSQVYTEFTPEKIPDMNSDANVFLGRFGNIDQLRNADVPKDIEDFRMPIHVGIADWFDEVSFATQQVQSLSLLIFDYMKSVVDMEDEKWLRLYASNKRIVGVEEVLSALASGATGDITTDIVKEDLHVLLDSHAFSKIKMQTQAQWLESQKINEWCDAISEASSYDQLQSWVGGDLEKPTQASFSKERDILTDQSGLGAFTVFTAKREI